MNTRIKICGITSREDALMCVHSGADAIGFVFYRDSPRFVPPDVAVDITCVLPPLVTVVGVFVDESYDNMVNIARRVGLDCIQLHGNEKPSVCRLLSQFRPVKAIRIGSVQDLKPMEDYRGLVSAFLLDARVESAYGGTGRCFDWRLALKAKPHGRVILSGGLTPENVVDAIKLVEPYGVDVSTGVEKEPGRKDPQKVRAFIESIRRYEAIQLKER